MSKKYKIDFPPIQDEYAEEIEDVEEVEEKSLKDVAEQTLGLTLSPNTVRVFAETAERTGGTFRRSPSGDQYFYWDAKTEDCVNTVLVELRDKIQETTAKTPKKQNKD